MIIAIDVGGTKTLIAAFNEHKEIIGEIQHIATARDPEDFIKDITRLIDNLKPSHTDTISIAFPGPVSNSIVKYTPNIGWRDFDIRGIFAKKYGCKTYVENDSNLAGLGAVRSLDKTPALSLYITIGTGIGGCITVNGKLLPAFSSCEVGHMIFQTEEGLKMWESMASGKAISEKYGQHASEIAEPEIWEEIVDKLSVGFRVIIPAIQPDIILIGGGVASQFNKFGDILINKLKNEIPDFLKMPQIIQAKNPETVVLEGCYYYAQDKLAELQATSPKT